MHLTCVHSGSQLFVIHSVEVKSQWEVCRALRRAEDLRNPLRGTGGMRHEEKCLLLLPELPVLCLKKMAWTASTSHVLSDAWQLAHENARTAQAKQKVQYDKKSVCQPLPVKDRIMIHRTGQVQGKAWKFSQPYFGPYEVVGITPTNAEVQLLNHPAVLCYCVCALGHPCYDVI